MTELLSAACWAHYLDGPDRLNWTAEHSLLDSTHEDGNLQVPVLGGGPAGLELVELHTAATKAQVEQGAPASAEVLLPVALGVSYAGWEPETLPTFDREAMAGWDAFVNLRAPFGAYALAALPVLRPGAAADLADVLATPQQLRSTCDRLRLVAAVAHCCCGAADPLAGTYATQPAVRLMTWAATVAAWLAWSATHARARADGYLVPDGMTAALAEMNRILAWENHYPEMVTGGYAGPDLEQRMSNWVDRDLRSLPMVDQAVSHAELAACGARWLLQATDPGTLDALAAHGPRMSCVPESLRRMDRWPEQPQPAQVQVVLRLLAAAIYDLAHNPMVEAYALGAEGCADVACWPDVAAERLVLAAGAER